MSPKRQCHLYRTGKLHRWYLNNMIPKLDPQNDNTRWHASGDGGDLIRPQPWMKSCRQSATAKRLKNHSPATSPDRLSNPKCSVLNMYAYEQAYMDPCIYTWIYTHSMFVIIIKEEVMNLRGSEDAREELKGVKGVRSDVVRSDVYSSQISWC